MFDFVTNVLSNLATGTYQVIRRAVGTIEKGRVIAGDTSTLTIEASVQPAAGRDLLRLPEGRRTTETRTVFTSTELFVGGQGTANEADLLCIDDATWEVQHCEKWPGYFKATVQRTEVAQ